MGRAAYGPIEEYDLPIKFYLQRMKMIDGDYDTGGAYWGGYPSAPMYVAESVDKKHRYYVRGLNREQAKEEVKLMYQNAKFFN